MELCLTIYMKNALKQSTYISYEGYIKNHFKPAIGNVELKELTPHFLQMFYNYKAEGGLSPKIIINMNLCLHKTLDQTMKEGLISSNPASGINLSRGQKPQIEILTRSEQFALLRASYGHHYGVFIRLVLTTGLRLGELLGHYSVSFTLDTYAHVLDDHKWEGADGGTSDHRPDSAAQFSVPSNHYA